MDESQELIQEFLIESNENLARLDQEFVELEQRPEDQELLSSIFRTIHTIKGTCGFLGFTNLEAITHRAENLLSQLRDGNKKLTPGLATLLLETVDVVKAMLGKIEASGEEDQEPNEELRSRLEKASAASQEELEAALTLPAGAAASKPAEKRARKTRKKKTALPAQTADGVEQPHGGTVESVALPAVAATPPAAAPPEAVEAGVSPSPPGRGGDSTPSDSAPPDPTATDGPAAAGRRSIVDSTIRVDVDQLDKLMNLVGELVLSRNQIVQHTNAREDATLTATAQRLNLITTELQAAVMKTRMQPIGVVWNKFPRVVRDLATSVGKQIGIEMEGAETELDKTLIEAIKDPLTHLVRNSCDHGVESPADRVAKGKPARGTLRLRAYHEGGQVNIEISDDGAGIDPQKIKAKALDMGVLSADQAEHLSDKDLCNLVFLPGLSTAKKITKVSGRGVGMDVVKTNIEKIGGSIDLQSWAGRGSTVKIKIPLTLAIIPALLVSCDGQRYAIPQVSLLELVRLAGDQAETAIEWVHGSPVYRLRGKLLPLVYLNKILGVTDGKAKQAEDSTIVVLHADEKTFGLLVDGVHDTQEIVVKPLNNLLKGLQCYAGATIMGDGRVALILDVFGIAQMGDVLSVGREHAQTTHEERVQETDDRQLILLFRSGQAERLAVPLALVGRLEEFSHDKIETARGRRVTQYRDEILPLVSLAEELQLGPNDQTAEVGERLQVVVFQRGERRVGVVVDRIVDVVEDRIAARSASERPGFLGTGVVAGRVTDFLDLQYILELVDQQWFGGHGARGGLGARILLAEGSNYSRGILRSFLEMNGHSVVEASSGEEALEKLVREPVDVFVSSLDLPGLEPYEVLKRIRQEPNLAKLPVVALGSRPLAAAAAPPHEFDFDDYQLITDREGALRSIERLAMALQSEEPVLETSKV